MATTSTRINKTKAAKQTITSAIFTTIPPSKLFAPGATGTGIRKEVARALFPIPGVDSGADRTLAGAAEMADLALDKGFFIFHRFPERNGMTATAAAGIDFLHVVVTSLHDQYMRKKQRKKHGELLFPRETENERHDGAGEKDDAAAEDGFGKMTDDFLIAIYEREEKINDCDERRTVKNIENGGQNLL